MKYFLIILLTLGLTSCGEREARRPVKRNSGSYVDQSVQRNKNLIAQEEKMITTLIEKDTLNAYESSSNGFWYRYDTQVDSISKPEVGDLVLFSYNLETILGQSLATREEIGNTITQIDQSNQDIITGIREGLKLMNEGETITFLFPSHKAYGYYGLDGKVPSNTPIRSTVTLLEIKDKTKN